MATGLEKSTCCQPEAVSLVNGGRGQQRARARPEVAHMGAGIGARLVEPDALDVAARIGPELHAQLHRSCRVLRPPGRAPLCRARWYNPRQG